MGNMADQSKFWLAKWSNWSENGQWPTVISSTVGGIDPFQPGSVGELANCLPNVDASDIVSYLALQTSFLTAEQFKAQKGLEAYNQFVSGWVKDVCNRRIYRNYLISARVRNKLI